MTIAVYHRRAGRTVKCVVFRAEFRWIGTTLFNPAWRRDAIAAENGMGC